MFPTFSARCGLHTANRIKFGLLCLGLRRHLAVSVQNMIKAASGWQ